MQHHRLTLFFNELIIFFRISVNFTSATNFTTESDAKVTSSPDEDSGTEVNAYEETVVSPGPEEPEVNLYKEAEVSPDPEEPEDPAVSDDDDKEEEVSGFAQEM